MENSVNKESSLDILEIRKQAMQSMDIGAVTKDHSLDLACCTFELR